MEVWSKYTLGYFYTKFGNSACALTWAWSEALWLLIFNILFFLLTVARTESHSYHNHSLPTNVNLLTREKKEACTFFLKSNKIWSRRYYPQFARENIWGSICSNTAPEITLLPSRVSPGIRVVTVQSHSLSTWMRGKKKSQFLAVHWAGWMRGIFAFIGHELWPKWDIFLKNSR